MDLPKIYGYLVLLGLSFAPAGVSAKVVSNRHYRFSIVIPDHFVKITDTLSDGGSVFLDTTLGTVFMFSAAEHKKFRSVKDYIDCSRQDLENELQAAYGDTSLRLISCSQPEFYPGKTVALHFSVAPLPTGQDTYTIYFIHHRRREIQVSFTYKKELERSSPDFIRKIMATLVLK